MADTFRIASAQFAPLAAELLTSSAPLKDFRESLATIVAANPETQMVVFPELHLVSVDHLPTGEQRQATEDCAIPLGVTPTGESTGIPAHPLVTQLGALAAEFGVWLIPGSICERGAGGELFNTALVYSPDGTLVTTYRKIFPWRPFEPHIPGGDFVVFDVPGTGRFGISICYDSWFPEVTRHLAWMGAEVVLNIVKTTSPDRAQELVLARANSIVNQTFTLSINCAGPIGMGRSIVVDPEGAVLFESADAEPTVIITDLDLAEVARVRVEGTAGTNRVWEQFTPADAPLELPLYDGRINPATWHVAPPVI